MKVFHRLEEEGYENVVDSHYYLLDEMAEAEFTDFCYSIGRSFVIDNMDDLFHLEFPENAKQQRMINRWNYLMRNIANVGMLISEYGNGNEYETSGLTWADVEVAESVLRNLKDICEFADITVKEV